MKLKNNMAQLVKDDGKNKREQVVPTPKMADKKPSTP